MGDMDLVRPLGLAGIRCAVVAPPGDPMRYSRFTSEVIEWQDTWKHAPEVVARLCAWGRRQSETPVLYYQEDRDLLMVSRYRKELGEVFRFVVPDTELVEDLVDKARFTDLAERKSLPVPPTRRLALSSSSRPEDVDLQFPLILKPLTRKMDSWVPLAGSSKALQVANLEELRELWPRLVESGLELLAQELIPGPETRIESYHVYVDDRGEIAGEFTGKKIRTYPVECGYSTALEITRAGDVAELGRELTRRLELRGVAKFDFKRGPNGKLYLLEINPRFTLWHHPGAAAGANIPALVQADLTGQPRPAARVTRPGTRWCYLWYDVRAAKGWGLSMAKWLPWALSCETKLAVAWDDPMPFLQGVLWRKVAERLPRRGSGGHSESPALAVKSGA